MQGAEVKPRVPVEELDIEEPWLSCFEAVPRELRPVMVREGYLTQRA